MKNIYVTDIPIYFESIFIFGVDTPYDVIILVEI